MPTNKGSTIYPRHRLHTLEPYYSRHVSAMTELPGVQEGLNSKSDIAEQLAWRDQAIAALTAEVALRELITDDPEVDKPTELDRLNPYKRGWVDNPTPAEQPASFIHGVRYYLGMLEDGESWDHSLGHIQKWFSEEQQSGV